MSLKLVPFKSLCALSYSPSIVTMAVSVAVCDIFSVKEWPDLENKNRHSIIHVADLHFILIVLSTIWASCRL